MKSLLRTRVLLLAAALVLWAATLSRTAHAGTLHVRDSAHVLSAEAVTQLRSVVAAAPFDARLAFTSEYPDARELGRFVASVTEPGMVAVGVDPQHHQVQVHFGTGSHVAESNWPAIERAGNDAFRHGDWEGGAAAIFRAAAASAGAATTAVAPAPGHSLISPGLLLIVVAGAIGIAIYFARRRAAYGPPDPYGTMGPPPGYGPGPFPGPGYPGTPMQGGMGPVGGGLIGAGLGGLAGYELGKLEGEREEREHGRTEERFREDRGGNFDEGGGGTSDEGGGGSSWDDDDSGGFDGGDGGGDAGGGGSDFS
ncbi:MAG: hypothetical protein WBY94_00990 [Polyangiaceae bacterium]